MEPTTFSLATILAFIIAIVIGIIAIVLAVHLNGKLRSRLDNMLDKDELREFFVLSVKTDERITREIKEIAREVVPTPTKAEMSTDIFNAIVDTVMVGVESKLEKMKAETPAPAPAVEFKAVKTPTYITPEIEKKKVINKYASAYDVEKKTFYKVEDRPSEETVFEFAIDGENENSGTMTVYKHAYDKVGKVRDFLDGACNVSGSGVNIQIEKEGIISFEGGKWRVEQPMEVKFI